MRKYFFILFLLFSATAYSQKASIAKGKNLCFPKTQKDKSHILISKSQLMKIETFISKMGEVLSYEIGFVMRGDYYVKNVSGNVFDAEVKKKLIQCTVGVNIGFSRVKIKHFNDTLVTSHAYLYKVTR